MPSPPSSSPWSFGRAGAEPPRRRRAQASAKRPTPAAPAATPTPASTPTASFAALDLLWQQAGPAEAKTETYWPAIDPITGNVWVSWAFNSVFWIFSPDGKYIESWGEAGTGPGQFDLTTHDASPDAGGAIAFAPDGSFYVTDVGNYRVEKFDQKRNFVTAWGSFGTDAGQFTGPKEIATDGKTVYVADDTGAMQAFDTSGTFLRSFTFPFVLFSLAPSGHLFSAAPVGILEVDGSGNTISHIDLDWASLSAGASRVVVDQSGDLFLGLQADAGPVGLLQLAPDGTIVNRWSTGGETMALSPQGDGIYVAYSGPGNSGWPYLRKYALPKS